MNEEMNSPLERLSQLNLILRHQLEQAELRIPRINEQLAQFAAINLLPETILVGEILQSRAYNASGGPHDSGQVIQAGLHLPGGLGIIRWDSEELLVYYRSPQDESEAISRFVQFDECSSAEKALLLYEAHSLLERLYTLVVLPATRKRAQSHA